MLRIVCFAAAAVIACSHAIAAEETIPINFLAVKRPLSDEPPPDCKGGGAEDGGDGDRN
jgi:hypothetical protein